MTLAGTDAARPINDSDALLRANLDALRATLPQSARVVVESAAPSSLIPTMGRDGADTFSWTDQDGRTRWLGETTMPSISEDALAEQFEPGAGNAILLGMGHGVAIRAISKRLRAHQAIFVVEPEAWRVAAALRLHDLSRLIRRGRLLLFVGPDAWDRLVHHLVDRPGFLPPERALAWPWFSRTDVRALSERISSMLSEVGERRNENAADPGATQDAYAHRILIASNSADERTHRWARALEAGGRGPNTAVFCCVPDDPTLMAPATIERRIRQLSPTLTLLIDCAASQLAFGVGDAPQSIVLTHTDTPTDELLRRIPKSARVCVRTQSQYDAAIAAGVTTDRLRTQLPGAPVPSAPAASHGAPRIIAMCDWRGIDAEDVGLHLASHQRLWRHAREWIARHADTYEDNLAADALAQAESALNIRLQSDDVRAGLTSRIAGSLGGRVVAESLLNRMAEAGIEFELRGAGWEDHPTLAAYAVRPEDVESDTRPGAMVCLGASPHADDRALAWLAAGRPLIVRRPPNWADSEWRRLVDCERHLQTFQSADELIALARAFHRHPENAAEMAGRAAEHLRTTHTWRLRFEDLLSFCGVDRMTPES